LIDVLTAIRSVETGVQLRPIYILVGTESVLIQLVLQAIADKMSGVSGSTVEVERYHFEDEGADEALLACQTMSLFAEERLVVLRHCNLFLATGKSKFAIDGLEQYLANPVPERVLVVTVDGAKLDERKKIVKAAKKHEIIDCNTPKEAVFMDLLKKIAGRQNIEIESSALQELARRSPSLSHAQTDLDKLQTYIAGQPISVEAVRALVSAPVEDNVFAWIDAVVRGQVDVAFQALKDVQRAGHDTMLLLAMMARQFRLMWHAATSSAQGQTDATVAARVGAHPYAVKVAREQSHAFHPDALTHLLTVVADAEFAVKSGRQDAEFALTNVMLQTCASTDKRTWAK